MMNMTFENQRRSALVKYSILLLYGLRWFMGIEQSWFCWISRNWKLIKRESHITYSYPVRDNDVRGKGGGEGLSLMTFWNSEKLWNFKVHKLSRTVNELCTYLIIDEKKSSNIYKISKKLAKLNSYWNFGLVY